MDTVVPDHGMDRRERCERRNPSRAQVDACEPISVTQRDATPLHDAEPPVGKAVRLGRVRDRTHTIRLGDELSEP
jgi:hypothetical protein